MNLCVDMYIPSFLTSPLTRPTSNNIPEPYIQGFLEKWLIPPLQERKYKSLERLLPESKKVLKELCQKDSGTIFKGFPVAKSMEWTSLVSKRSNNKGL